MSSPYSFVWLIPALPFLACLVIVFLTLKRPQVSGIVSVLGTFAAWCLAMAVVVMQVTSPSSPPTELSFTWLEVAGFRPLVIGLLIDPLGAMMLLVVTTVSTLVQIYSLGYMAGDRGFSRFFAEISLFTFSMLGLVLANNFLQIYIFWELVGLCSYLLIGFYYDKKSAGDAAKKAFVVTRFGDFGFLLGILFITLFVGNYNFVELGAMASAGQLDALFPGLTTIIALLIFSGAMGKSAQFPLHVWLPDAMEGPSPVSALIHAATMVAAGVYLVARNFAIFAASPLALDVVAYVGGFTALFAATIAVAQNDIKRILAYSTLSQLGYMMMALGVGGLTAGSFHLMTHAFFKALLFLGAGSVIHALHTNDIWEMGGLRHQMKATSWTFIIGSLALAGIFPLAGFWSKDEILTVAFGGGRYGLFAIGLGAAFLTAFYMFRLCFQVFGGKVPAGAHPHESPRTMTLPLVVLGVLSVVGGLVGIPALTHNFEHFIPTPGHEGHFSLPIALVSTLVALAGIGLAWLIYGAKKISAESLRLKALPLHKLLANKYYVDEIYTVVIRYSLFVLAAAVAWFDRHIVDGAVNVTGWLTQVSGHGLRTLQSGRVQAYLLYLFLGVVILLGFLAYLQQPGLCWLGGAR
ncbi:MAG: NADH-quinone oxidoreductase subunit L [Myxococcota bacterium]|nr:NADH-quinone oxidoreductase subunit L [Myxococcota bacterium]